MKHAGQKSVKDKLPEQRKGPKRAVECRLKVQTHVWEQDVGSSSLSTRTILVRKAACSGGFLRFIKFVFGIIHFASYGLLLLVRPRI